MIKILLLPFKFVWTLVFGLTRLFFLVFALPLSFIQDDTVHNDQEEKQAKDDELLYIMNDGGLQINLNSKKLQDDFEKNIKVLKSIEHRAH